MPPVLTDKRNWFDTDTATSYAGGGGARLWKTAKSSWVLEDGGVYSEQPPAAAFEWLIENGQAAAAEANLANIWDERSI
jgi:hypothetical protein